MSLCTQGLMKAFMVETFLHSHTTYHREKIVNHYCSEGTNCGEIKVKTMTLLVGVKGCFVFSNTVYLSP